MTDEEIHNIYLHMSGKAEGLVEANGNADFPVLFARAILEYEGMTKDVQNMASKSTYKEQLETKDEPVAWRYKPVREDNPRWEYTTQHPLDMGDGYIRPSLVEYCKCIEPLYAKKKPKLMLEKFKEMESLLDEPPQRTWVGLTEEDLKPICDEWRIVYGAWMDDFARDIEAKLKEKNT